MFSMPKYIQYPKNDIAQDVGHDDRRFCILHGHGHTTAFVRFFRRVLWFFFRVVLLQRIRTSDPLERDGGGAGGSSQHQQESSGPQPNSTAIVQMLPGVVSARVAAPSARVALLIRSLAWSLRESRKKNQRLRRKKRTKIFFQSRWTFVKDCSFVMKR